MVRVCSQAGSLLCRKNRLATARGKYVYGKYTYLQHGGYLLPGRKNPCLRERPREDSSLGYRQDQRALRPGSAPRNVHGLPLSAHLRRSWKGARLRGRRWGGSGLGSEDREGATILQVTQEGRHYFCRRDS